MGEFITEVLEIKDEMNKAKARIEKYRSFLIRSFYSGGVLLLSVLWWIIFPSDRVFWSNISNVCFVALIFDLWVSYRIISKIKSGQLLLGDFRIKLRQKLWEKNCDCQESCDYALQMEKELAEEYKTWHHGILAEVEREIELS